MFWLHVLLMYTFFAILRIGFCEKSETDLILSIIQSKIESLDLYVKQLDIESAEMRSMILEMNNTFIVRNNFANVEHEEIVNQTSCESTNAQRTKDKISRLFKAFKDEKASNANELLDLRIAKDDMLRRTELLENKSIDLFEKMDFRDKVLDSLKAESERDFEKCESQIGEALEQIQKLKADLLYLNGRVDESISERDTKQERLECQCDEHLDKATNFKVNNSQSENICDDLFIYNKDLDNCYLFVSDKKTWDASVNFCISRRARLIEMHSQLVRDSLKYMFKETGLEWGKRFYDGFWTGGYRCGYEFCWVSSRSLIKWTNWHPEEPNNQYQDRIVVMFNDEEFRWDDQENIKLNPFICEKSTFV